MTATKHHWNPLAESLERAREEGREEGRREGWRVHNHGVEDGRGVGCYEYTLNGRLVGECLIEELLGQEVR